MGQAGTHAEVNDLSREKLRNKERISKECILVCFFFKECILVCFFFKECILLCFSSSRQVCRAWGKYKAGL